MMIVHDRMFDFEIGVMSFDLQQRRPIPPPGYKAFDSSKAHCQAGSCPNCGAEKPGISGGHGSGFQDRRVQNVMRAMERIERRTYNTDAWKSMPELFSTDLDSTAPQYTTMLKCHPSRYGTGAFMCCGAKIWHDFCSFEDGKNFTRDTWNHYYLPTQVEKALKEGTLRQKDLFQANADRQEGLAAFAGETSR